VRDPDPADRRVHLLRLTAAGKRLHSAVQADIRREETQLLARLPKPDRDAFVRCLEVLSDDAVRPA
jgi:DNA-binding MarR family transcriptional regulator